MLNFGDKSFHKCKHQIDYATIFCIRTQKLNSQIILELSLHSCNSNTIQFCVCVSRYHY